MRRVIGYVPQALSADANLTGVENVELFARLFDVPRRERKQRVTDALDAMGLTEAAMVYLSDSRGETFYTLVVHPLTGRVTIQNRYLEAPVDVQYDDEGNRIEQ